MSQAPLMLSVSGLRGLIGQSLTPVVATRYAAAFGTWLKAHAPLDGAVPHVVIGRDSRPSGQMIELAATAGLLGTGCRVTQLGIASTPAIAVMAGHLKAHGGMVITASHNPIIWNGIKCLRHDGVAPDRDQANRIIDTFQRDALEWVDVHALDTTRLDDTTAAVHTQRVLAHVDPAAVRAAKLRVVVDSVHGAGGPEAAMLLEALGIEVVHLYKEPTGHFPHIPEPTRENLVGLCEAVREHGADLGFAQDPDADRLAIVDEQGRYIGEEYTLALCADHVLRGHGQPAAVVANLSTSRMIDDIAAGHGATVIRTPVGEANVAMGMQKAGAVVGGEGNGGIILPTVSYVRDSLVGMALVLEQLAQQRKPMSAVVDALRAYAIVKDKVDIEPGMADQIAPRLRRAFKGERIDEQDGVRVDLSEGWVHVRPSNTEPIVRVIAEAADEGVAQKLIRRAREALGV